MHTFVRKVTVVFLAAEFGLGSWSIAFTHWEVYGTRAPVG